MMLWLAGCAALLGFATLALAMPRHHKQVWRREASRRRKWLLGGAGWTSLLMSLFLCQAQVGWGRGLVWWAGLLTLAALLVTLILSFRPNWFAHVFR